MNTDFKQILWVEGNGIIIRDIQNEAQEYGLNLVRCDCWDDAYTELSDDYTKWAAVILQPKSKLHAGSIKKVSQFLPQAFSDINVLSAVKGKTLPWYLLTDIKESDFTDMVLESRKVWDSAWPKPYYDMSIEEERRMLFKRIKEQTQLDERLQVKSGQYKQVFEALDYLYAHNLNHKVGEIIEDLLVSICFGNGGISDVGVVREVLEHLFYSMVANDLLPNGLKNISNRMNNNACCRLLSGRETDIALTRTKYRVIVPIMNGIMAGNIYNMLQLGNNSKHAATDSDSIRLEEYLQTTGTNNLLNSCALQLCDIIIWYEAIVKEAQKQIAEYGKVMQWWATDEV